MTYTPDTPLEALAGIGPKKAQAFQKLGVATLRDLAGLYPRRYEDRTQFRTIADAQPGEAVCIRAAVAAEPRAQYVRSGLTLVKVRIADDTGALDVTYFNQPYRKNNLHAGETYIFYGKVEANGFRKTMTNPVCEQAARCGSVTNCFYPIYPLTTGDKVKKGTPLVDITIPDWVEAQSEFLLLSGTGGTPTQIKGVLERLRLAGMPDEDIQRLRATRTIQTRFTIRAPIDGAITAFDLRTGMNISKDKVVAQIQGMDPVWIGAAVPESIAYLLKETSQFAVSIPAYPDKSFPVEKWSLLPSVDPTTRTLQVRLQVSNKDELLKPGMNAYLKLNTQSQEMLLIPSQAVIDTGKEQRVITVDANGKFVPKRIHVLHESQQQSGIGTGLEEGESVVVSGLFLIDSEANITGALERMRHAEAADDAHSGH